MIKLLLERRYYLPELEELDVGEKILSSFEIDRIEPETLLFQTGYLTIKGVKRRKIRTIYRLSYPNLEVKVSFTDALLDLLIESPAKKKSLETDCTN